MLYSRAPVVYETPPQYPRLMGSNQKSRNFGFVGRLPSCQATRSSSYCERHNALASMSRMSCEQVDLSWHCRLLGLLKVGKVHCYSRKRVG